jgi:alpha,alpha-trehalose phosphorylase
LKFRYSLLDKARDRARQVNQKGALFPWRTINGEESSAYFAAGTAQYHINADIIYAMKKYVNATGDMDFLYEYGTEMLIETARLWFDLGSFSDGEDGKFNIHGVTGPDEYTALVDNNLYTNMMARDNLRYAVATICFLQDTNQKRLTTIVRETKLEFSEVDNWRKAAEQMYLPYDKEKMIHPQDDNFLEREKWDFENTPDDKYPLLLHFHPLVIYRFQVIKQADVVMAMFLLSRQFTFEEKLKNFQYYDPITTGDSSLSACVQGIIAAELGLSELASQYFRQTVLMDFGNVSGNVDDGAHIAAMGGTWLSVVYGVGGMRDDGGEISFKPRLLEEMDRVKFPITIRGQRMDVDIELEQVTYSLREGTKLKFKHIDKEITLEKNEKITIKIEAD